MGKRRLTSAQIKRLNNIQAHRLARAKNQTVPQVDASLGSEQPGLLIAHYGTTLIVESQDGKLIRCARRQNLGTLVTGDNVIWQAIDEHTGVVVACQPRRSVITRPDMHQTKAIVANVDLMVIVVALAPLPQQTTLDRYLILAKMMQLTPLIVVNKCDLLESSGPIPLLDHLVVYRQLGYSCLQISTKTQLGFTDLQAALQNITSILVGQSGLGKSSLLNMLVPDAKAQTNVLSQDDKLGRHTTTASTLYHLPHGGNLIDSPGIHQFNLRHFSQEAILKGFTEFLPYLGQCKFRNCLHEHEPYCALKDAVSSGKIASFRLENYHAILLDHVSHS